MKNERAVPKLILAKSYVLRCAGCGSWLARVPQFMYQVDDDHCPKCGCTSYRLSTGRPYGPKSQDWSWIENEFNKYWRLLDRHEYDTVVCVPPLGQAVDDELYDVEGDIFVEEDF